METGPFKSYVSAYVGKDYPQPVMRLYKRRAKDKLSCERFATFCEQASPTSELVVRLGLAQVEVRNNRSKRSRVLIVCKRDTWQRPWVVYDGPFEPEQTWGFPLSIEGGDKVLVVLLNEGDPSQNGAINGWMPKVAEGCPAWYERAPKTPFDPGQAYRSRANVVVLKAAWETPTEEGSQVVLSPECVRNVAMELFYSPEADCFIQHGGNAIVVGLNVVRLCESLRLGPPNGVLFPRDERVSPLLNALLLWLHDADPTMPWISDLNTEEYGQPSPLYLAAVAVRDRTS